MNFVLLDIFYQVYKFISIKIVINSIKIAVGRISALEK